MAITIEERKKRQVESKNRRIKELEAKREGRSLPSDPTALIDVDMAAMYWKLTPCGAATRIRKHAKNVMFARSPSGKRKILILREEIDQIDEALSRAFQDRTDRHIANLKAKHHCGAGKTKKAVECLKRPQKDSDGKDENGKVHYRTKPEGWLTVDEMSERWRISVASSRVRIRNYAREIATFGRTSAWILKEEEAERIDCAVQDAKRAGTRIGGRLGGKRLFGLKEGQKAKHRGVRRVVDGETGQEEVSYRRFFARSEDCSWIETSRTRKPGELFKILGLVRPREASVSYCEDCTSCVHENFGGERYVGCLHEMMSLDKEWSHKCGSKLYREKDCEVERLEWVDDERKMVKRVVKIDLIRREEVRLYELCPYFKARVFVDKSAPIDDSPREWEIDPNAEMNEEEVGA
jgi:hypothetical protein